MSTKYRSSYEVPNSVIADRLDELAKVITKRPDDFKAEFTMRIPVELDRDANVVMAIAAERLRHKAAQGGSFEMEALAHMMANREIEE